MLSAPPARFAPFVSLGFALLASAAAPCQADVREPVDFNRDIRPLLSDRCFVCHGFDGQARKANLRLDTYEGLTSPRERGAAVVPGAPEESQLVHRINSDDEKLRMPPASSGLSLTPAERQLLQRWIAEGAEFEDHWAFVPLAQAAELTPPPAPLSPSPRRSATAKAIDGFVGARLSAAHLRPNEEATATTLIRRLHLDLHGLPPSPDAVRAFVRDQRPDRFERLVDDLLASPRFGERMALVWLDAARYADTNGFHHDNVRTAWPYRDWVINAFNQNQPYDQFLVEQLAGDLLPNATEQQKIATAFCRMHNINDEGGAIDAEYRVEAIADRIETVGTALMGLTVTCARCHDHKYDPITQEDYFGLYAFFNSVDERGVYPNNLEQARGYPARLSYKPGDLGARIEAKEGELAAARSRLDEATPELTAERDAWRKEFVDTLGVSWLPGLRTVTANRSGTGLAPQPDGSFLVLGRPTSDRHTFEIATEETDIRLLLFEALTDGSLPQGRLATASHGNAVVSYIEAEVISARDPTLRRTIDWSWAWADHEQANGDFDLHNALRADEDGWALAGHLDKAPRVAMLVADQPFGFDGGSQVVVTVHYESQYGSHVVGRPRVTLGRVEAPDALLEEFPTTLRDWWYAGPFEGEPADFDTAFAAEFAPQSVTGIDKGEDLGSGRKWQHKPDWRDATVVPLRGENAAHFIAREIFAPTARQLRLSLGSDDGLRVFLDGEEVHSNKVARGAAADQDTVTLDLTPGEHLLVLQVVNGGGPAGFYFRATPVEGGEPLTPQSAPVALLPRGLLGEESPYAALVQRFGHEWNESRSPTYAAMRTEIADLERESAALAEEAVPVIVMQELDEPRPAFVLDRGAYDGANKDRPVQRRPPAFLGGALPDGAPVNRLGFAQWLTQPDHPLTARVHVNRIWQMLFGRGLVATTENFGMQAEWPSHPALLDWLARRFVDSGWDQKALIRGIVTSATYRQSARRDPAAVATLQTVDPRNALLSHFPRRRLPAELVRDNALSIAGLLVDTIGGPSVRPYQPAGLWREVSIGGSSNTRIFRRDDGDALYRRSLYTFWKRTSPPPQMSTFDAPTREFCVVRRGTTNTPLQALVLWNDEQFVEAARALATRTLAAEGSDAERLAAAFMRCTSRAPEPDEAEVLDELLRDFRARYQGDDAAARALLEVGETSLPAAFDAGELAAWTMVANALLNLDETIVRP